MEDGIRSLWGPLLLTVFFRNGNTKFNDIPSIINTGRLFDHIFAIIIVAAVSHWLVYSWIIYRKHCIIKYSVVFHWRCKRNFAKVCNYIHIFRLEKATTRPLSLFSFCWKHLLTCTHVWKVNHWLTEKIFAATKPAIFWILWKVLRKITDSSSFDVVISSAVASTTLPLSDE